MTESSTLGEYAAVYGFARTAAKLVRLPCGDADCHVASLLAMTGKNLPGIPACRGYCRSTAGVPGAVRPAAPDCCNGTGPPSGSAPVLYEHPASFTTHRWNLAQKNRRSKANFAPAPGDPYRIRTDVNGVRGRCLNHLTNGPLVHLHGLEPGTH